MTAASQLDWRHMIKQAWRARFHNTLGLVSFTSSQHNLHSCPFGFLMVSVLCETSKWVQSTTRLNMLQGPANWEWLIWIKGKSEKFILYQVKEREVAVPSFGKAAERAPKSSGVWAGRKRPQGQGLFCGTACIVTQFPVRLPGK